MFPFSRTRLWGLVLLAGACAMTAVSIRRLPPVRDLFHFPATPFDRTNAVTAADFLLLREADKTIPRGRTVTLITEARDAARESNLLGLFVALLPGRHVLPSAQWGAFTPEIGGNAEYVIVVGPAPAQPIGTLLHSDDRGTIWKRRRP